MLKLRAFRGRLPKVHPTNLPDGFAQVCRNAKVRSGAIVPYRSPVTVETLPAARNFLKRIGSLWQGYNVNASPVPGPVNADRIYVSGNGAAPRVESYVSGDEFSYALALPRPSAVPSVTVLSGAVVVADQERTVFCITHVTSLDEESEPSPLSPAINYTPNMVLRLSSFGTPPTDRAINRRRIYRSSTDSAGQVALLFIGEQSTDATFFDYDYDTSPMLEPLPSSDYNRPPTNLAGFTVMPNGVIAAFSFNGKVLHFCEPYRPHAWPAKYRLTLESTIVGLSAFGSALAVMTKGTPYTCEGAHPANMVLTKIEENLPCIAARGIVDLGYAAAYPSPEGLVLISMQGARVASREMFGRDEWVAQRPTTFVAAAYDGSYAYLHQPAGGGALTLSLIDFTGAAPDLIDVNVGGADLVADPASTDLFILGTDGVSIRRFDDAAGAAMTATWRSKRMILPTLINMPWGRIDGDGTGDASAYLYGNGGTLIGSILGTGKPARMPGGRLDDQFQVEVITTTPVAAVGFGFDVNELV